MNNGWKIIPSSPSQTLIFRFVFWILLGNQTYLVHIYPCKWWISVQELNCSSINKLIANRETIIINGISSYHTMDIPYDVIHRKRAELALYERKVKSQTRCNNCYASIQYTVFYKYGLICQQKKSFFIYTYYMLLELCMLRKKASYNLIKWHFYIFLHYSSSIYSLSWFFNFLFLKSDFWFCYRKHQRNSASLCTLYTRKCVTSHCTQGNVWHLRIFCGIPYVIHTLVLQVKSSQIVGLSLTPHLYSITYMCITYAIPICSHMYYTFMTYTCIVCAE